MKSHLEKNKNLLRVDDFIFYTDSENCMRYKISEIFEDGNGFKAIAMCDECNVGKGEEEYFLFKDLQVGWSISENTMEYWGRSKYND